jgi:trk system potassium uptake protein
MHKKLKSFGEIPLLYINLPNKSIISLHKMRIVIAGAGEVGSHLAKMLSSENHDIVLIDLDEEKLRQIGSTNDLLVIPGNASSISLLKDANIQRADLFIGVTESESTNIVSAVLSKQLGAKKTIARIDNSEYLRHANKPITVSLGVDYMIYPEMIAANEIVGLLQQTGMADLVDFSRGKLSMSVIKLDENAPIVGKTLNEAVTESGPPEFRAVAITRDTETLIPKGSDRFQVNDHVYIITSNTGLDELAKYSGKVHYDVHDIMILGGSRIGERTAKLMGKHHNVKLIELKREKAFRLSNSLDHTLVINGDGSNLDLLMQEGIKNMDAFIAVTGNSETNILSSTLAKQMGVKKTIAEVENIDYIKLAESMGIDTIINKKLITAGRIFRFTMSHDVASVRCLTGTTAELMEFTVKKDSKVTKGKLNDISFPKDAMVGGVIRGKSSFIAWGDTEINPGDRVVVFALPSAIPKIPKYFN